MKTQRKRDICKGLLASIGTVSFFEKESLAHKSA